MTQSTRPSPIARLTAADRSAEDADALRAVLAAQRETAEQLARETAALRREAAELLSRSRWWRDECRRELLRCRLWYGARSARAPEV
jgi:cell division protein FtsB